MEGREGKESAPLDLNPGDAAGYYYYLLNDDYVAYSFNLQFISCNKFIWRRRYDRSRTTCVWTAVSHNTS